MQFGCIKDDSVESLGAIPLLQDFLLHQQKCSKPSSEHAVVISLAHLSDVDVLQLNILAPYSANVVGLIGVLIE